MTRLLAFTATLALLAGCATSAPSSKPGASLLPGPSQSQEASLPATASLAPGDTTLTPGCFLTPAEVEAATCKTLARARKGARVVVVILFLSSNGSPDA